MRGFLLTAFVLLASVVTYGQENIIRWTGNQPLQWDDFAGQVCDTSKYDAETFAEITYRYYSNNLREFSFEVSASFNKNTSWRRKELQCEALLKHEQFHFNIAALFSKRLKHDFENYNYTLNYNREILRIFNKNKADYQAMQLQYDEETNHSLNKQKQKEWEDYIENELRKTSIDLRLAAAIP